MRVVGNAGLSIALGILGQLGLLLKLHDEVAVNGEGLYMALPIVETHGG